MKQIFYRFNLVSFNETNYAHWLVALFFPGSVSLGTMTEDISNDASSCDKCADLSSVLMDLHTSLDPIDAENFDVVSYVNEVCCLSRIISVSYFLLSNLYQLLMI